MKSPCQKVASRRRAYARYLLSASPSSVAHPDRRAGARPSGPYGMLERTSQCFALSWPLPPAQRSRADPPSRLSRPELPFSLSRELPPLSLSRPEPPFRLSLPELPEIVSLPLLPKIRSLPEPPPSTSLREPPQMMSLPRRPFTLSLPPSEAMTSRLLVPVIVSAAPVP